MTEKMQELQAAHDAVKEHPFRKDFEPALRKSYISALFRLSAAYSQIIYHEREDDKILSKSGEFIHNYNSYLSVWRNVGERCDYLVTYYDLMLGVIHEFLRTEEPPPYIYLLEREGPYEYEYHKAYLVTSEEYPEKSDYTPGYFEIDTDTTQTIDELTEYFKKWLCQLDAHKIATNYVNDRFKVIKWLKKRESK